MATFERGSGRTIVAKCLTEKLSASDDAGRTKMEERGRLLEINDTEERERPQLDEVQDRGDGRKIPGVFVVKTQHLVPGLLLSCMIGEWGSSGRPAKSKSPVTRRTR
ncbi:hypothetical protein HHI36_007709 [Cryptolaemus montrouzieri]|uniref:Uncharacterized protein n=1 Tax=Cryptolaemus montrouzieri TaxID=559131 RepID=A0ABD2MQL8_9CUCU